MTKPTEAVSCYEVMAEVKAVTDEVLPGAPVFLVGGGPAAAIAHPGTRYDHDGKRLIPAADSAESTLRANGTKRDLDLVAFRVLGKGEGKRAEKAVLEAINDRMVVSVFGIDQHRTPTTPSRLLHSVLDWTSRRTVDEQGIHRYQIYPLEQVLPEADLVYQEWQMELPGGGEISVMSPDTTVANYDVRSVFPRTKDAEKLRIMRDHTHSQPQFVDRIHGPLMPIQELANAIVQLGNGTLEDDSPLLISGAGMLGRGAFRARANAYSIGQQSGTITKLVGHTEFVQKMIKGTTGRK